MSDAAPLRLAFVSAPGGSLFMEEILSAVADAVSCTGTPTVCHRGIVSEVAAPGTRFVVVPHEYSVLAPEEPASLSARTIGFGVEHPGTKTFATSVAASRKLGARFEISTDAVEALRRSGLAAEHFTFGYVESWDRWHGRAVERAVDVVYLGTADPRRLGLLARVADDIEDLTCELLVPPHEPMTTERPDFLTGTAKWEMLARSKVLLNLHRENKVGLEWVRCLEAIINGCVVVTEPCSDYGPLVPGEHIVVAEPRLVGAVARAISREELLRQRIAADAYELCRADLRLEPSVRRLVEVASALPSTDAAPSAAPVGKGAGSTDAAPLAEWIPVVGELPTTAGTSEPGLTNELVELARLRSSRATLVTHRAPRSAKGPAVDVVCASLPGDGPLGLTVESLAGDDGLAALHVAVSPAPSDEPRTVRVDLAGEPVAGISTYVTADLPIGRARARNALLAETRADLVCVVDAGDALRPGALRRLVQLLLDDPAIDIGFAMATLGQGQLVNVLVPERRRLARFHYLTRGYVVRRSVLECVGGFTEDPLAEGYVDHLFWRSHVERGCSTRLARWIGFALWPQRAGRLLSQLDPRAARALMVGP